MNNQYYKNGELFTMTDEEQAEWLAQQPTESEKLQTIKDTKCKEIDTATANAIVDLAGDVHAQANKQAKSSQLIRKEALGTITADEKLTLDYLDSLFLQIETLIAAGNDKEAQIQACTTLEEYEQVCLLLGV